MKFKPDPRFTDAEGNLDAVNVLILSLAAIGAVTWAAAMLLAGLL